MFKKYTHIIIFGMRNELKYLFKKIKKTIA